MLPQRIISSNRTSGYSLSQRTAATKTAEQFRHADKQFPKRNEITIKLIGDLKENIHDIVSKLSCTQQSRQEIEYILSLYGQKIDKLRQERNLYRDMLAIKQDDHQRTVGGLKKYIERLQQQIKERSKVPLICQRCTCFDQREALTQKSSETFRGCQFNDVEPSTNRFRQEYLPHFNQQPAIKTISEENQLPKQKLSMQKVESRQQQLLIENDSQDTCSILKERRINTNKAECKEKFKNQTEVSDKTLTEEQLFKLMLKYNFSFEELENVLEEYENEHKTAYELFDSEQQRNLYRLGQKMHKQLWNKKVVHDVKRLSLIKNQGSSLGEKGTKI